MFRLFFTLNFCCLPSICTNSRSEAMAFYTFYNGSDVISGKIHFLDGMIGAIFFGEQFLKKSTAPKMFDSIMPFKRKIHQVQRYHTLAAQIAYFSCAQRLSTAHTLNFTIIYQRYGCYFSLGCVF